MSASSSEWSTLVDVQQLAAALAQGEARVLDARATASTALRVLDARFALADPHSGAQAYAQGHIPGAVHADLNRDLADLDKPGQGRHPVPESDTFAARLGTWGDWSGHPGGGA